MAEIISTAVALLAAFELGYGLRGERERQQTRRPKTLKRLMREQGIKPWQPGEQLPGEPMSEEEWASWEVAMREVRGR